MNIEFDKQELQDLYIGNVKGKPKYYSELINQYKKKIKILKRINSLNDLKAYKGLHFEPLKGNL